MRISTFRSVVLIPLLIVVINVAKLASQGHPQSRRYVAITFDDLPVVCRCETDSARNYITDKLLATFEKFNIPVLGVVNEQKLETNGQVDAAKVALLRKWLAAGHELGNHGYSHKNINEISFEDYKKEILLGERITRELAQHHGKPFRFYRHPYLSAGDDLKTRRELDTFLAGHGYEIVPNTITYQDYTFSGAYEAALRKRDYPLAQRIRDEYISYTLKRWEYAEKQSLELFGREINHILMVHANLLNADAFEYVAKLMQGRGYAFVSIDEAMKDPVYSRPDRFDGKVGVTWLTRWAAENGASFNFSPAAVPEFVLEATRQDARK